MYLACHLEAIPKINETVLHKIGIRATILDLIKQKHNFKPECEAKRLIKHFFFCLENIRQSSFDFFSLLAQTNKLSAGLLVTNTDSLAAFLPPTFESLLAGKLLFTVMKKDGDGRRVCSKL